MLIFFLEYFSYDWIKLGEGIDFLLPLSLSTEHTDTEQNAHMHAHTYHPHTF